MEQNGSIPNEMLGDRGDTWTTIMQLAETDSRTTKTQHKVLCLLQPRDLYPLNFLFLLVQPLVAGTLSKGQ